MNKPAHDFTGLADLDFIDLAKTQCKNTIRNTAAGAYLLEALIRLEEHNQGRHRRRQEGRTEREGHAPRRKNLPREAGQGLTIAQEQ